MTALFLRQVKKTQRIKDPEIFFDIGANKGQTIREMRKFFPHVKIYAFEPNLSTYNIVNDKNKDDKLLELHQIAFNRNEGTAKFLSQYGSPHNHIIKQEKVDESFEIVSVITGDTFCQKNDIDKIDFLKIDAEGYDLDILVGFGNMLRLNRIKYIQVECTTNLDNHFHVHLERFIHFMHPFGYRLFGLYEFIRKIVRTQQNLNGIWFCNAVFVVEIENPKLRIDGKN